MRDGSKYDLIIAGTSAASLILIITRSLVAVLPREPEVNTDRFAAASPQLTEAGHAKARPDYWDVPDRGDGWR